MLIKKSMQILGEGNTHHVKVGDEVHILKVIDRQNYPHHMKFIGEVGTVKELFPDKGVIVDFSRRDQDRGWLFLFGEFEKV